MHWKMIEEIMENKSFDPRSLTSKDVQLLVTNLLPQFNSILHLGFQKLDLLRVLYSVTEEVRKTDETFFIPFFRNINGKSPIHLCFESQNIKAAEVLIANLANEGIDNHGRAIVDQLHLFIKYEVPSLSVYLESRFK